MGSVWEGPLPLPLPLLTVAPRAMARFCAVARRCGWSMLPSDASAAQYALSPPRFEAQRNQISEILDPAEVTCKKVKRQFFTHLPDSDVDCSECHFLISEVEYNYDDQTFLDAQRMCTCHDAKSQN